MIPISSMMQIIAVVIILLIMIIVITSLYHQNKIEKLRLALEQSAAKYSLSFSTQELMDDIAIAFDEAKNKLLFLDFTGGIARNYLVDINEVKGCLVITTYDPISNNSDNSKGIVQTVSLQFNYKNEDKILMLPFYILSIHPQYELEERIKRAEAWQVRLSKHSIKTFMVEESPTEHW